MGKCPSCGASSFFGVNTRRCAWCGKTVCNRCVPVWQGSLIIKASQEMTNGQSASYETVSFCSISCFNQFWQQIISYPADYLIGTDIENFGKNWIQYWNASILNAFSTNSNKELYEKTQKAVQMHSAKFPAFPWCDSHNKYIWQAEKSSYNARLALAQNLEKCGRTMDAAKVFEQMRLYDKARELREKERHILIKKTDVSVNINALLQQIKDSGLVAIYRCPRCGGNLKIGKNTSMESLRKCEHCGSEIETMDLTNFLTTILS